MFIEESAKVDDEEMNSEHAYDVPLQVPDGSSVEVSALESLKPVPGSATDAIEASPQDPASLGAKSPESHDYEFQSHDVVGTLGKLLVEFVDDRAKLIRCLFCVYLLCCRRCACGLVCVGLRVCVCGCVWVCVSRA